MDSMFFLFSHRLVRVEWCDVGILILSIKTSWQGELQINSADLESASLGEIENVID